MNIFPAIDLYNGKAVRLTKGKFDTLEVFSDNPVQLAKEFEKQGATWIHIIDLNGAQNGSVSNADTVRSIINNTNLKVQVGGGVRSKEVIEAYLEIGVNRVILGSFAIKQIDTLESLVQEYKDKIVVSVDCNGDYVTYHGWQDTSKYNYVDFCNQLEEKGIKTIVFTDIAKDGMMSGPNIIKYKKLAKETKLDIIASGGVSSLSDIKELKKLGIYGAIIGKALYLNKMTVQEAITCSQEE